MRWWVILVSIVLLVGIVIWVVPSDIVKGQYRSLDDARKDGFIERGWLPDKLPPSTYDIAYTNNLDVNVSAGKFRFAPSDYALLQSQMAPYDKSKNPHAGFAADIADHIKHGHPALQVVDDGSVWVFTCVPEEGTCDYVMWLDR